ncbi:hypothetical protein [Epilithonimonas sp.]|uniref:hypothetical protein n=1 Tax=Epilithonimonas sp. TaxID=2894511 RepID=UPI0035AFD49F
MRKLIVNSIMVSALLLSAGISNSCSKIDDIIDITIPVPFAINNNFNADIPFVITTEFVKSPDIPLNLNLDEEIKARFKDMSVNNLKSAKLSSFTIDYLSSSNNNAIKLDKVKDAELWIKAPNVGEVRVAAVQNNISDTALNFTPDPAVELADYLKSNQTSIYLKIKGTETAATQMQVRINSSFKIQVSL